jgi:hypothetical protein
MPGKGTVPRVCEECALPFLAQKRHVRLGRGRWCSRVCWTRSVPRTCEYCGLPFAAVLSHASQRPGSARYCSQACYHTAQRRRVRFACLHCGGEAFVTPRQAESGGGKYCSQRCSVLAHRGAGNANWRGGRSARPDRYVVVRSPDGGRDYEHRVVYAAAYGAIPAGYEVHHRNGVRDDNRLENLCLLSASQHRAEHGHTPASGHPATPSPRP